MATAAILVDGETREVEISPQDITTGLCEETLYFAQYFYDELVSLPTPEYQNRFLEDNNLKEI